MRVLIVSAWSPTSGVRTVYRNLARHLAPQGVRYSAYAFDGWSSESGWTFCDELIDGRRVTLTEVLIDGRFDLLHCVDTTYSPPYGVETWVRRARFRGPVVLMAQVARRELTGPVHATAYVACSESAARILELDADGPVQIVYNGYDEDLFRPGPVTPATRPTLGWVGRSFDPQKDAPLFLDAVESLPDFDAELADQDPGSEFVAERIANLSGRVRRSAGLGPAEMADFYRRLGASGGALVSTSTYEGFPLALSEAMACRCPVIAPRIPGHEHLKDGLNALLYDRENGARGIQECVQRLADPALRAAIVDEAQHQARSEWTSAQMATRYLAIYRAALARSDGITRRRDWPAKVFWRSALRLRPRFIQVTRRPRRPS